MRNQKCEGGPRGARLFALPSKLAEDSAATVEDFVLLSEVSASGLDELNRWEAVGGRDFGQAEILLQRGLVGRATLNRGERGRDQALDAGDHADAGNVTRTTVLTGTAAGKGEELKERRVLGVVSEEEGAD